MSELCMIDAGNNRVNFDQMDQASNLIVQTAIDKRIGGALILLITHRSL